MKDFLTTLANFSPAQLLTSLAVLTPFVVGIWVAMKWAYDTRLKNLETSLADFRADFERKFAREMAKVTDAHEQELEKLKTELKSAIDRAEAFQADLHTLERELQTARNDQTVLVSFLPRLIAYLCEHPHLIFELPFTQELAEKLQQLVQDNDANAMYVYGRMLITGRIFGGGTLPPDRERGLALVRRSAERGHSPSIAFYSERATEQERSHEQERSQVSHSNIAPNEAGEGRR